VLSTNLKVSGVGVFSAGDFLGQEGDEIVVYRDRPRGDYRKLAIRNGRLAGAILVGDTSDAIFYRDLITGGQALGALRDRLIFGEAHCRPQRLAA
jgi:nitrite reductase (NADH) large subunit